jgi:hypothetical protein
MFGFGAQGSGTLNGSSRAASTSTSVRKTSSASSFGDDLSDLFGGISFPESSKSNVVLLCFSCVSNVSFSAPASSDVFQDVEGESEERRRARLERHQRTRERAVMFFFPNYFQFRKKKNTNILLSISVISSGPFGLFHVISLYPFLTITIKK